MTKNTSPVSTPNSTPSTDDDNSWTSDDVPCFSLGEGTDKKGNARKISIVGTFMYSIARVIKRRRTILHRLSSATVDGIRVQGECLVYGSGSVNHKLACIPPNTKVRLTYKGELDVGQDSPMKNILVEWPRGTRLLAKGLTPKDDLDFNDANDDDCDVPF